MEEGENVQNLLQERRGKDMKPNGKETRVKRGRKEKMPREDRDRETGRGGLFYVGFKQASLLEYLCHGQLCILLPGTSLQ